MGRKKSVDMNQVLMVCAIGMIALFVGVIFWGIIDSFLTPSVTVGEPAIKNVIKSAEGNRYEVTFSVKNEESRQIKAFLNTEVGFKAYRVRHSTSPKPNFYRVFQAIGSRREEVSLLPRASQEMKSFVDVKKEADEKYEIKPETEISSKVTLEKASWEKQK